MIGPMLSSWPFSQVFGMLNIALTFRENINLSQAFLLFQSHVMPVCDGL